MTPRGREAQQRRRQRRAEEGLHNAPVPAALTAGASGSTTYPLSDRERAWDAAAALSRWEESCGIGGDNEDWAKFADGFFWTDGEQTVGGHKLLFVDVIDGTPTAVWRGVTACAAVMQGSRGGVQIPDGDRAGVRAKIAAYYTKAAKEYDDPKITVPWKGEKAAVDAAVWAVDHGVKVENGLVVNPIVITDAYGLALDELGSEDADGFAAAFATAVARLIPEDNAEGLSQVLREALQITPACECKHPVSEHIGGDGPCKHEDGRGTCSCGGFKEMSAGVETVGLEPVESSEPLVAAAGDVAWGPEDGFIDLLCDVNEALEAMLPRGAWMRAVDASIDLDKVVIVDRDSDVVWVAPITMGPDREPILSPQDAWVPVEEGLIETGEPEADEAAQTASVFSSLFTRAMRLSLTKFEVALPAEMTPGETAPEVAPGPAAPESTLAPGGLVRWNAVLCPEGKPTSDGRIFAPGSVKWRDLPLSLMAMIETQDGHTGAELAGRIDRIWRDEEAGVVRGEGVFDAGEYGAEIARLVGDQTLRGVSVDIAIAEAEIAYRDDVLDEDGRWIEAASDAAEGPELLDVMLGGDDEAILFVVRDATIGAATVCPFPAFAEASIQLSASLVAAAQLPNVVTVTMDAGWHLSLAPEPEAVTASAAAVEERLLDVPEAPPADWFAPPNLEELTPLTITPEGRIYGHAAAWDTCHIGFPDVCVTAPRSEAMYAYFLLGEIECEAGERLAVGQITLGTGHARNHLSRADAVAHYDNTGLAVADVNVGEDEYGIWVAGALRPDVSAKAARELSCAKLSGDWRNVNGHLELCALLAVNVPGFPVPRPAASVVASAEGYETASLVAAGVFADSGEIVGRFPEAALARIAELAQAATDPIARINELAARASEDTGA